MAFSEKFDFFHEQAQQFTGLSDFGAPDYHEAMNILLRDLDKNCRLNPMGLESVSSEIIGNLIGRLVFHSSLSQSTAGPLAADPLFIIGMTRTGSTVLHRLISEDPNFQSLPMWLGSMPIPRPPKEQWYDHPYYQMIDQSLQQLDAINPEFRVIHPMFADEPDECRFVINQTFWAASLIATASAPEYFRWMLNEGDGRYAFRYYRKVLEVISNNNPSRWILKDPSHMYGLDALLAEFPNARIIQTHRDPLECIASVTNLCRQVREMRETDLTLEEQREQAYEIWPGGLEKTERVRARYPDAQFLDIHISETRINPIGTMERIYDFLGYEVGEPSRNAWEQKIKSDPDGGHKTDHKPVDFGFDAARLKSELSLYYPRYEEVANKAAMRLKQG